MSLGHDVTRSVRLTGGERVEDIIVQGPENTSIEDDGASSDDDEDRHFDTSDDRNPHHGGHIVDPMMSSNMDRARAKWWKLYTLHFMFMWNSRTYEYAAIVLVALAFPGSLLATSIRGITMTISSILCASAVGSRIDRTSSRLYPLLLSISANHGAIIAAYLCWLIWPYLAGYQHEDAAHLASPFSNLSKGFLFGLILLLDVLSSLGDIANKLAMEQEWIPVLVGPTTPAMEYSLTHINAVMSRIDLICKIVAPSLLPLLMASFSSRSVWIFLLAMWTGLLWGVEIWCAQSIAKDNRQLQVLKKVVVLSSPSLDPQRRGFKRGLLATLQTTCIEEPRIRLAQYFSMHIWPASMASCFLSLTVLVYSATFITYLLSIGFSLSAVTLARGSGSFLAFVSTFLTPKLVQYLREKEMRKFETGSGRERPNDSERTVVRKVGFWGVSQQFLCLLPVVLVLWNLSPAKSTTQQPNTPTSSYHFLVPLTLFTFLSLSRVGHWANGLMVQEVEQTELPASARSTFVGTEKSLEAAFELAQWGATVVWSRPEEFRWLALGSACMIGSSAGLFGWWSLNGRVEGREVAYVGLDSDEDEGRELR